MNEIERIIALSNAFGPSGFEDEVAELIRSELPEYETGRDHMTNVYLEKEKASNKPRVMLDAHMDEVGLVAQAIKPNGMIRFLPVGGWQSASFPSSSFNIRGRDGQLHPAVVAVKPPHFLSAAEKAAGGQGLDISAMILDPGTTSKAETEALGIGICSPAVPDVSCRYDEARGMFYGKAFDDRIGAAAEIETLKQLAGEELPCNLTASFSVQEEVGDRGVKVNAERLRPDVMIAFEGCPADDTFSEEYMIQSALKKGPMLRHLDVSMITNWRFQKFALDVAKECGIPVQESVRSGGGTNGAAVYHTFGVPAIVIGIPVRYIHSSNCWCALEDYRNAVRLAVEICRRMTREVVEQL